VFQTAESGYECLVHLTAPSVRIPATRLDQNTVVCDSFQVTSTTCTPNTVGLLFILFQDELFLLLIYRLSFVLFLAITGINF